jgi:flagellar protein FlaG
MNLETFGINPEVPRASLATDKVETARKKVNDAPEEAPTAVADKKLQPEELLSQIKTITEDGLYSVQFENNTESNELIVKVIDRETNEVVRQIPPEELLELTKHLNELRGNIVETVA